MSLRRTITFLLDANIFLEVLLDQQRAEECLSLLRQLTARECTIALTGFSLHSIGLKLESRAMKEGFRRFLTDCMISHYFLLHTSFDDESDILLMSDTRQLDIDDAHQYWAAKKLNARLVSFDADFDKTDIRRWEPADIFKELQ